MKLTSKELYKEFLQKNRHLYPEATDEQIIEACSFPWKYVRKNIESGEFPVIRMKYFGVFQVYPKKAKSALVSITKNFKAGKMIPEQFFKIKNNLENYLKKHEEDKEEF